MPHCRETFPRRDDSGLFTGQVSHLAAFPLLLPALWIGQPGLFAALADLLTALHWQDIPWYAHSMALSLCQARADSLHKLQGIGYRF